LDKNVTIGGAQLRDMIIAGAVLLEKNKAAIDALNVFPVPDGDTGTNMSMTMRGAVREIRALPEDANATQVADALSMGALKGARAATPELYFPSSSAGSRARLRALPSLMRSCFPTR
jgi:dihydroxyacetone kinase-like predicted kinase